MPSSTQVERACTHTRHLPHDAWTRRVLQRALHERRVENDINGQRVATRVVGTRSGFANIERHAQVRDSQCVQVLFRDLAHRGVERALDQLMHHNVYKHLLGGLGAALRGQCACLEN